MKLPVAALALVLALSPLAALRAGDAVVKDAVDWPAFMAKHDMVWKKAPTSLYDAPLLGNGMLGAYVRRGAANEIVWEIGRADVQDHRTPKGRSPDALFDQCRLPVGVFTLKTAGKITGWDLRFDLWNAVLTGTVATEKGKLKIRTFIPARDVGALIAEVTPDAGEISADWSWTPSVAVSPRLAVMGRAKAPADYPDVPNPAPVESEVSGVRVCTQKLDAGETVTAWKSETVSGMKRLVASVAHTFPSRTAATEAVASVEAARAKSGDALAAGSAAWWHAYYGRTFVSLPDEYWTAFYWTQMYKLAAATREDGVFLDLQGPWTGAKTPWPGTWWNLNIQLTYSPCYTGNRLDIADSLRLNLRKYRANLIANAGKAYPDSAGIGRASPLDAVRKMMVPGVDKEAEIGSLQWTCLFLWKQYRVTMDESILRDDLFPLLRRTTNYYLHFAKKDAAGKIHLPSTYSPEYGASPDCNYDLALFKWGCATLLKADALLGTRDPLAPKWKDVVDNLTDFPTDKNGYRIGADVAFEHSHRHYSHLFMIYPLKLVDVRDPATKDLIEKSVAWWHGVGGGKGLQGYSYTGGCSILATAGDGEGAYKMLNGLRRFVQPNTLYRESGPVIETPLSGAESIHDLLLQSAGDAVRVFPVTPKAWPDVAFRDLLAEGGFKISAERRAGATAWVKIESRAGEPLVLSTQFSGEPTVAGIPASDVVKLPNGDYRIRLPKGAAVVLSSPGVTPELSIVATKDKANPFGLN